MLLHLDSAKCLHGMHWDYCTFQKSKDRRRGDGDGRRSCMPIHLQWLQGKNPFYNSSDKSVKLGLRLVQTYLEFKTRLTTWYNLLYKRGGKTFRTKHHRLTTLQNNTPFKGPSLTSLQRIHTLLTPLHKNFYR